MTRMNPYAAAPQELQRFIDYATTAAKTGLEASLQHLVKVRASQINGCAICIHMHTAEARKDGETEERLYLLDAWHEAPTYTARERAALGWTDALTRLTETRAPDAAYDAAMAQFTPEEMVKLTLMITTINSFNRLGVGFRQAPLGMVRAEAA
jgi:AhpD family alkylhydroperoxidase